VRTAGAGEGSRARELWLAAAGWWLLLAATATAAGICREQWLVPRVGELRAHQAGTLIVIAAFLGLIWLFVRRLRLLPREALVIGIGWVLAAISFEFGFGHWVDGLPWRRLLSDYDLSQGRLLVLLWATVGAGPFVLARFPLQKTL
jgi:hypothetical protein